jgi:hypothetical protein
MNWKIGSLRTNLYLISTIILVTGLGSAAFIYQSALNDPGAASGYEVIGGFVYSSTGENSKMYIHDLERFGGKAAVLSDEFMRWFAGLWHGKSLAWTVACITIFISLCFIVAANLSSHARSGTSLENNRDRTD